jgi:methylmalonyl-CoA epimerase
MIIRIDHIAIAVRDLQKARAFFIDKLGGKELFSAPLEDQNFKWTTIELGTSCFVELIDPIGNEGFLHRFLDQRGDGMHHITIQVDDSKGAEEDFNAMGIPTFGYNESLPGWKEFFVHPKDAFGTLLQFVEFNPLDWINPGYVPKSYQEFLPEIKEKNRGKGKIEARRFEDRGERTVELSQGNVSIRVDQKELPGLITALEEMLKG